MISIRAIIPCGKPDEDLVRDHNLQAVNKHPSTSQLLRLTFMIMVNPIHKQEFLALCSRHSQHQHKHMRPYSSFKQSFHLYHKSPCFWQQILSRFEFLVIICYCHLAHFNYTFKEQPKRTRNPLTSQGQRCQKTEVDMDTYSTRITMWTRLNV